MSQSYFSEAPKDFRVSSTESESHYIKCLLCYTIKKNFYCVECIKAGNFVHSSLPYSDRFADKQVKLLRVKANRRHVQDSCETLLHKKSKYDSLQTDVKLCKDKVEIIKLAIAQRKNRIQEYKKELTAINNYNTELRLKLPRYQKRVSSLGKHALVQKTELETKRSAYELSAGELAALRRARIRQLTKYIFPVYITYDSCESIDEMEFLHVQTEDSPMSRERLHVVAAWLPVDGDYSHTWVSLNKEGVGGSSEPAPSLHPAHRTAAALALAAQLVALLAWTVDMRLPYALSLSEYVCTAAGRERGTEARARRLCACVVALGVRAGTPPPPLARHAFSCLHALTVAPATDDPMLGRVSGCTSVSLVGAAGAWAAGWPAPRDTGEEPPEHITWPPPDTAEERASGSPPPGASPPPPPAASLVTSAAASLASLWRGWAK